MTASTSLASLAPVLILAALTLGFWAWSLIDLLRRPARQWDAAEHSKILWLAIVIVFGVLGSVAYLLGARPALKRFEFLPPAQFDPTAFGVPDGGVQYNDGHGFTSLG